MRFVGIDLAWAPSNPSGVAVLERGRRGVRLVEPPRRPGSHAEVLGFLGGRVEGPALLAVDAPIRATNPAGTMRRADRETHRLFGRFFAGAYPANRSLSAEPVRFGRALERRGFPIRADFPPRRALRASIEVFPAPAIVWLSDADDPPRYKKGRLAERRAGLGRLQRLLARELPRRDPPVESSPHLEALLGADASRLPARELKDLEDRLDALVAAWVGCRYWLWGRERSTVLGDDAEGFIVVPADRARARGTERPRVRTGASS